MYAEWASLQGEIETDSSNTSVLNSFPHLVGRDVSGAIVKNLAQNLTIGASNSEPSKLTSEKQVKWTMEVLCYGLSLPLNDFETIRDCVHVYCEWMSALTVPKMCVPKPVVEDPNPYMQIILRHLLNVFLPRYDAGTDQVQRQVVMCHRVLRAVEGVAAESVIMTEDTWHVLLQFLLAVNDALLAPPTVKGGIGDQLCERVVSVLFKLWLLACARNFPSPPLWKTFREMCAWWRHHEALVTEWHRVNMVLTSRLLKFTHGPDYPELQIAEEDQRLIPEGMDNDCVAQSWFRFLHILSNPVDLSRPHVISNTPKFLHMALASEVVLEPHQHECLRMLPYIFFKAMKGLSVLVDAFLGISQGNSCKEDVESSVLAGSHRSRAASEVVGSTPPSQRRNKAFSIGTSSQYSVKSIGKGTLLSTPSVKSSSTTSTPNSSPGGPLTLDSRPPLAASRPKCNSILHLFGAWLFEAGLAGVKLEDLHANPVQQFRRTSSFLEKELLNHHSTTDFTSSSGETQGQGYEAGRAEACGALCRIICSHKTGEEILPVYLSRFYLVMYYTLKVDENISGQVLANVIFNSCDLLRIDLDGVQILLPYILKAIEYILDQLALRFRGHEQIPVVELRKASIHLLLSMLCLPLHFKTLQIKAVPGTGDEPLTFLSLKMRLIALLLKALLEETDSANTQMLLGGLFLCVQDLAMCEEAEETTLQDVEDLLGSGPANSTSTHQPDDSAKVKSPGENGDADGGPTYKPPNQLRDCDTARGLFGQAASLVCNRLMASWKMDLNIALAAMEVLSGLAKVKLSRPNSLMCKRTVKWICDFIVYQCSRPAPAHSKDLHSMIVAAFNCLTVWLVEHSFLLQDKECLHCVLEVVELGISGSKSQNRASDVPKLKGEKELKPASMRVKDAAEALLTTVMEHVGSFPPPCGPESLCSLLNEESLLKYCRDGQTPEQSSPFRYFVVDNTVIIGLLEQPLGNEQDPLPTVTALVRGPFGRHAWTMQLRHLPRHHKVSSRAHLIDPGRPEPVEDVGVHHNVKHRYFPPIVDTVPLVQADKSIPAMSDVISSKASEIAGLNSYIQQQVAFESAAKDRLKADRDKKPYPDPDIEYKQPSLCHEFQTARLFLSQFNFLSLEALKEPTNSSLPPSLVILDTKEAGFHADFEILDNIPSRTCDTAFIFYVKPGQKMPFEILHNVTNKSSVQPVFLEFLRSLGWPVDVHKHAGWTGHVNTSWKILDADKDDDVSLMRYTGGGLYDGRKQVLYWADVCSEIAFVVPSPDTYRPRGRSGSLDFSHASPADKDDLLSLDGKAMKSESAQPPSKPQSLSLNVDSKSSRSQRQTDKEGSTGSGSTETSSYQPARRLGRHSVTSLGPDTKVFIVWLESYEDHVHFPANELVQCANTGLDGSSSSSNLGGSQPVNIIFIHALRSGLFRIRLQGHVGRINMAIPLVDGMVVSRRTLGTLVRQTVINIAKRKRLENDSYQPPHVRRKLKIQEIVHKHRNKLTEPEFYTALFQDPTNVS